jgi:chemotaxis protein CheC
MTFAYELSEDRADALCEIANIGAGHAATALSQLTNLSVMISVPKILLVPLEDASSLTADLRDKVTAVLVHMLGDGTGHTLLLMRNDAAMLLCDLLLQRTPGTTTVFQELEQSCLREAGNILAGAYLSALSTLTKMVLLPSTPTLVVDRSAVDIVAQAVQTSSDREFICEIETAFSFEDSGCTLKAAFLLIPDNPTIKVILDAIRVG